MLLRLEAIYLQNWQCYKDQRIKFDLDKNHKIWIIFGQNGYGKTSLLEAIVWCLYGVPPREGLIKAFNRDVVKINPELEMSVQLQFERAGNRYLVSRSAKRIVKGDNNSVQSREPYLQFNGKEQIDVRERIEEILPKSCKDFFFFDGAKMADYATLTQTTETREAIERILGIPELQNLCKDTELAKRVLGKKLDDLIGKEANHQELISNRRNLQIRRETLESKRNIAKQNYADAQKVLTGLRERANQIEAIKNKFDVIDRQEVQKKDLQKKKETLISEITQTLQKASILLLRNLILEAAEDLETDAIVNFNQSGNRSQLLTILDTAKCLCGRCLDETARQYILRQIEQIENVKNYQSEAIQKNRLYGDLKNLANYSIPNIKELLLKQDIVVEDIKEIEQNIERLKQETVNTNQEEIKDIWLKVGSQEKEVENCNKQISNISQEISKIEDEEKTLLREIHNVASQTQQTDNLRRQIDLANRLFQAANELIEWYIQDRKNLIESETSKIHHLITNKTNEYQGILVRDNYTLGIKHASNQIINPENLSVGENQVLAFAFIAGLNIASGKAAPLIMDTPFGNLDLEHQENIIKSLPDIPSQVILLATDRDLLDDRLRQLRPYVAEIHRIRRDSEYYSYVEVEV
jgi:DNA sulfur modification protein DndD